MNGALYVVGVIGLAGLLWPMGWAGFVVWIASALLASRLIRKPAS